MANLDNLIEAVAAGGSSLLYWGRISILDEVTGKKKWSKRRYTVVSVDSDTRQATLRINDTGDVVTIDESRFKLLYKKAPRLPDEISASV